MASLHSSSGHYDLGNAQPAHVDEYSHETYNTKQKNRVDQPFKVCGVTVIRPLNELFSNAVDY